MLQDLGLAAGDTRSPAQAVDLRCSSRRGNDPYSVGEVGSYRLGQHRPRSLGTAMPPQQRASRKACQAADDVVEHTDGRDAGRGLHKLGDQHEQRGHENHENGVIHEPELACLATGSTASERTPWAPWIRTPSMSAVADGPVWKHA